jgi:hypothetical protein
MYGLPHAVSWSHEQLLEHTSEPRRPCASFSAQIRATNSPEPGSALAFQF